MEDLKQNPIIQFNPNQLYEVRKVFGYEDINRLVQDLNHFEEWIAKQNHFTVKKFDREYLERFIIYNKGSVEKAKKRLDKLCTMRNMMPDFLMNFDIRNEFNNMFKCMHICFLPKPTVANYRVVVTRWFGYDEDAKILDYYRYIIMMSEYALRHDYCLGYEVISDTTDIEFGMVKKINPILIHKALTIVTEAMGQRLRMIHFISGSMFLDSIITIFKQGLTAKLAKRIQIHSKFDTIYEHVARENLPSDFGGDLMNIAELTELQHKEFSSESNVEWIKSNEKATTDETRRLTDKFNEEYMGMPGSFKVLCVD